MYFGVHKYRSIKSLANFCHGQCYILEGKINIAFKPPWHPLLSWLGNVLASHEIYIQNYRPLLEKLVTAALEDIQAPLLMPFKALQHLPGGALLVTMKGHHNAISGVAVSSVEDRATGTMTLCIVTSSWDKTLKSWDLVTTGALKTFDGHTDRVMSVSMTTNGQYAASGSADMTVR